MRTRPKKRVGIRLVLLRTKETNLGTPVSFDSFPDFNQSSDSENERLDVFGIERNDESNQSQGPNNQEDDQNASSQRRISYDRNLPARHSYLGEFKVGRSVNRPVSSRYTCLKISRFSGHRLRWKFLSLEIQGNDFEELNGRIVLEEESIVTIPLLCLPGVVLIPGQLLPLQFQGSYFTQVIKDIVEGDKIFGLVPNLHRSSVKPNKYNNVRLHCLGTIVEVRSYGSEQDGSILKIKAEGKERFLIKETWTNSNRTVMGKVFILPEVNSRHPFRRDIGLSSMGSRFNKKLLSACTQYPIHAYSLYDPEYLMEKINQNLNQWASFSTSSKSNETQSSEVYENRTISQATGTNQPSVERPDTSVTQGQSEGNVSVRPTNTELSTDAPVSVNTTRTVVTRIVPVRDSESEEDEGSSEEEHGFKGERLSKSLKNFKN